MISTSDMYKYMLPDCKPSVVNRHNLHWKKIWKNAIFSYIDLRDRDIIFKFIHEILPNKTRLYQIRQTNSPLCPLCNVSEDNIHMFEKCKKVKLVLDYFRYTLNYICGIENVNLKEMLYLDIKIKNKKKVNTAIVLTSQYISTIWYNRGKSMYVEPNLFKVNILRHQTFLKMVLKERMYQIFTDNYCSLNVNL